MNCDAVQTLIAAYADGEIDVLRGHRIRRHLRACPRCASTHQELLALRAGIRAEVPYFAAPSALRERVLATLDRERPSGRIRPRVAAGRWQWMAIGAVAGCAVTVLAWIVGGAALDWRTNQDLAVEAVTTHVRATLGNHQVQVASSDRHTVKPWLSARLDYSPPVRDLAHEGFPLVGGRIDYLDRRPVATLVYRYRDHMIDVFVSPSTVHAPPSAVRTVRGFNVVHARGSGMDWLAVSDVNTETLSSFVAQLAREE